jgi:hypothetical protein
VRRALVAGLFVILTPTVARQALADDPAALFDAGLAAMAAGHYDVACPKLAASFRLDPHAGGLFTLAECENKWGRIASAVADYEKYLDMIGALPPRERARQEVRTSVVTKQLALLAPDVPHITLRLDPNAPSASTVTIDGDPVEVHTRPQPRPIDPGEHVIAVHAPDGRVHEDHVVVARAESRVMTVSIDPAPVVVAPPADESPSSGLNSRSVATVSLAGVGGVGLLTGAILGGIVLANKSTIDKDCPTPGSCSSSSAVSLASTTQTEAAVSTAAFIVSGVALGSALVLWLTRPSSATKPAAGYLAPMVVPSLASRGAALGISGAF